MSFFSFGRSLRWWNLVFVGLILLMANGAPAATLRRIVLVDDDCSENNDSSGNRELSRSDVLYRRLVQELAQATGAAVTVEVVPKYRSLLHPEILQGCDLVVWYTGASYGGNPDNSAVVSLVDETTLTAYLDQTAGVVVVVSPGYLSKVLGATQGWDNATWPFVKNVLGLRGGYGLMKRFIAGTVTGTDGAAYVVSTQPAIEAQFSVVNPEKAQAVFTTHFPGKPLNDVPAAIATVNANGQGKIIYVGFTLENLKPDDANAVFRTLLTSGGVDASLMSATAGPGFIATSPTPTPAVAALAVVVPRPAAFQLGKLNDVLKPGALAVVDPKGTTAGVPPIASSTGPMPAPAPTPPPAGDPGTARPVAPTGSLAQNIIVPTAAPVGPAPVNIRFQSTSPVSHQINWETLGKSWTKFRVYRHGNEGWREMDTDLRRNEYTDQTLVPPNTAYRIVAVYTDGSEGTAEATLVSPVQPTPVTNLTAFRMLDGGFRVNWDGDDYGSYQVYGPTLPATGLRVKGAGTTLLNVPVGTHMIRVAKVYGTEESILTASLAITIAPASGRYRLLMLGAKAVRTTTDDPLQLDGKGDEIYAGAYLMTVPAGTGSSVMMGTVRTKVYGDTQGFPDRIAAGSAGSTGGIRDGDSIPSAGALLVQAGLSATNDRFPLLVWDGTLTDPGDGVVVMPAIFEWDNGSNAGWEAWTLGASWGPIDPLAMVAKRARIEMTYNKGYADLVDLADIIPKDPYETDGYTGRPWGPNVPVEGDRPIGTHDITNHSFLIPTTYLEFEPRGLVLGRSRIEGFLGAQNVGRIEVTFTEYQPYTGNYKLYFQIERMDANSTAPVRPTPMPTPMKGAFTGSTAGARTTPDTPITTLIVPGAKKAEVLTSANAPTPTPSLLRTVAPTTGPAKFGTLATPPPVGSAPTGLSVTSTDAGLHTITWQLPDFAAFTSFSVYRKDGEVWHQISQNLTQKSYDDHTFIPPGTTYRVEMRHSDGSVGGTEVAYPNPPQPEVVTHLTASQTGPGKVHLEWKLPSPRLAARVYGPGAPVDGSLLPVGRESVDLTNVPLGTQAYRVAVAYGSNGVYLTAPGTLNTTVAVVPDHANYRVTVLGIRASQQTVDDPLERDGKGDEIYLGVYAALIPRVNSTPVTVGFSRTLVMGDTNGFPTRVRAGTAGSTGGIRTGDAIPSAAALVAQPGIAPTTDRFPLQVWQGELSDTGAALALSPQLFEWDNGQVSTWNDWANWWSSPNGIRFLGEMAPAYFDKDIARATFSIKYDLPPDKSGYVVKYYYGISASAPGDRLIGSDLLSNGQAFSGTDWLVVPRGLVLTHQNVERFLGASAAGVFIYHVNDSDAVYKDSDRQGSYDIYLQIERVGTGTASGAPASTPVVAPR